MSERPTSVNWHPSPWSALKFDALIERHVEHAAQTLGLRFQRIPCSGEAFVIPDEDGEVRVIRRQKMYAPAPMTESGEELLRVVDAMLLVLHQRFGTGRVWTLDGRVKLMLADATSVRVLPGRFRDYAMLRMYYVHENDWGDRSGGGPMSSYAEAEKQLRQLAEAGDVVEKPEPAGTAGGVIDIPKCCGSQMVRSHDIDQVECLKCRRTVSGQEMHAAAAKRRIAADTLVWNKTQQQVSELQRLMKNQTAAALASCERKERAPSGEAAALAESMRKKLEHLCTPQAWLQSAVQSAVKSPEQHSLERKAECLKLARDALGNGKPALASRMVAACRCVTPSWSATWYRISAVDTDRWRCAGCMCEVPIGCRCATAGLRCTHDGAPVDPLDVKYDGVTLRELVSDDISFRHEELGGSRPDFTPAQRAAISAHWSAELRRKVEASKERERQQVVVDLEME